MSPTPQLKVVSNSSGASNAKRMALIAADYSDAERKLFAGAADWLMQRAGERQLGGQSLLEHGLATAEILRVFRPDADCLAAALLMQLAGEREAVLAMREQFGAGAADLAEGAARMASIEALGSRLERNRAAGAQLETLRKMLLAMAQDMRVVLIKLADHVQLLRVAVKSGDDELRANTARLALDIYSPLANRLGVWQLKWEIEDLALRILEPRLAQVERGLAFDLLLRRRAGRGPIGRRRRRRRIVLRRVQRSDHRRVADSDNRYRWDRWQ